MKKLITTLALGLAVLGFSGAVSAQAVAQAASAPEAAASVAAAADAASAAGDNHQLALESVGLLVHSIPHAVNGLWAGSGLMSGASEALEAQRIARLAERPEGSVTRFDDISLRALATANLDRARDFVATEPGVLGAGDETTRRLAATVRTYLDEHGSRGRTAKRLSVHENTVSYRLRQAEELLGRSVDKRTLELRVALALAELAYGTDSTDG